MKLSSSALCVIASAFFVAGCSSFNPAPPRSGTGLAQTTITRGLTDQEIAAQIDPRLSVSDRTVVMQAMERIKNQLPRVRKIEFMYFDANGQNYANSPELKAAMIRGTLVPGTINVYQFSNGMRRAYPQDPAPQPNLIHPMIATQPSPYPNTGPYRRILTPPGYAYIQSDVYIPCNTSTYNNGDGGYAMLGGFGAVAGAAADAGLEDYAANGGTVPQNEAVFIKLSSPSGYTNGVYSYLGADGGDHQVSGYNAHLQCDQTITQYFYVGPSGEINVEADGAVERDGSYEAVVAALSGAGTSEWPQNGGGSTGIILKRFTGIAQSGDDFNDQSVFGVQNGNPVIHWANTYIGTDGSGNGSVAWDGSISGTAYQLYPSCADQYHIVLYALDGSYAKSFAEYEGIQATAPVQTC